MAYCVRARRHTRVTPNGRFPIMVLVMTIVVLMLMIMVVGVDYVDVGCLQNVCFQKNRKFVRRT